jgi:hypothetical protein
LTRIFARCAEEQFAALAADPDWYLIVRKAVLGDDSLGALTASFGRGSVLEPRAWRR